MRNLRQAARRFEMMIQGGSNSNAVMANGEKGKVAAVIILRKDKRGNVKVVTRSPKKRK